MSPERKASSSTTTATGPVADPVVASLSSSSSSALLLSSSASPLASTLNTHTSTDNVGTITGLYIAPYAAKPMVACAAVTLIPGVGIVGDRYAATRKVGTYSGAFFDEPGRQVTILSADAIEAAFARTQMAPLTSLGDLRRNIISSSSRRRRSTCCTSSDAGPDDTTTSNNNTNHQDYQVRLFVHRRTVPCKYREAHVQRRGLMNNTWGSCGISCEILSCHNYTTATETAATAAAATTSTTTTTTITNTTTNTATNTATNTTPIPEKQRTMGEIRLGDTLQIVPGSVYEPHRIQIGRKPPGFFIRPMDRSREEVEHLLVPKKIALWCCLIDPVGFQRIETSYQSVGQHFWSTTNLQCGLLLSAIRIPFMLTLGVTLLAILVGLVSQGIQSR